MIDKYYDMWESYSDVKGDYREELPPEDQIIYAGYTYESYSGDALVVFAADGKVFENNDGHCSCYGLENWNPEETTLDVLHIRKGWPGLSEALIAWEAQQ
jgi:hypothetical protein